MSLATTPRDPVGDHLLTPQNAALVLIDYQPSQFAAIRSIDRDLLLENIVSTVKTAQAFDLPIVHSTINVATGRGQPTVPGLAELLEDDPPIDRTTTNAWEDADFLAAVRATGTAQADPVCTLDGDLHGLPRPRRAARGLRRLPGRRRDRWHERGGPSHRHRARRPGRRSAGHLGRPRRRAPARLGARGDGGGL